MILGTKTRFHMGTSKRWLMREVRSHGAAEVFPDFKGTDQECLQALQEDPREAFVPPECDNQGPSGRCLGHPA